MTDPAPLTVQNAPPAPAPWAKKQAQEARRRDRRANNERLFSAVMAALEEPLFARGTPETRLNAVRAAIAAGGDVNARATLVEHHKERPLGMVARRLGAASALEVMQVLLDAGADLHAPDKEGNTLTHTLVHRFWSQDTSRRDHHLREWLARGGAAHLAVSNQNGNTPLSLSLLGVDRRGTPGERPPLIEALVNAGARVQDLPPQFLYTLLEKNHRPGFDLAVGLGADPQQRRQADNLWGVWAQFHNGASALLRDATARRSWMERLIELGVNPGAARKTPATEHSALMLLLGQALTTKDLDEVCLARLKALGCPVQAPGTSPLHALAALAKSDHLATLHRLGFDLAGARDDQGETLVHAACAADLRGLLHYAGETRTVQDTVAVLLAAGCPPDGLSSGRGALASPLALSTLNPQARDGSHDRIAVAQHLIHAGASLDEAVPSSTLLGHLLYKDAFSTEPVPWNKQSARNWKRLSLSTSDHALATALLQHGARVPDQVVPDGMPFLLGLVPPAYHNSPQVQQDSHALWTLMVDHEAPRWTERLALQTLRWLGRGESITSVKHGQAVAMIEWCVAHGVDENTWGMAARTANLPSGHPLIQYIEAQELRATMRTDTPTAPLRTAPSRPRL